MSKYIVMGMQKASYKLYKKKFKFLPRVIFLATRLICGCSIPPSVEIGDNTKFTHNGLGCVIHDKCIIGHDTTIQANVVVGGKNGVSAHIGNHCYIGAGAVLLGGITVGDNSVVGANAVVTQDVPANVVVAGVPAKILKQVEYHDN